MRSRSGMEPAKLNTYDSGRGLRSVTRARSGVGSRGTVNTLRELGSGVLNYALRAGLTDVPTGPPVDTHIRPGKVTRWST